MKEIWKDIYFIENNIEYDYRNLYKISNNGIVKSISYNKTGKEKILKPEISNKGYLRIGLNKNGKKKHFSIHRLVAHMFVDGYFDGAEVDHIIPLSLGGTNNADNLRWVTSKDNHNNQLTKENYSKANKGCNHPQAKKVAQYEYNKTTKTKGNLIKIWDYIKQAEDELNINNITACCKGRQKTSGGYMWEYYDEVIEDEQ